MIRTMMLIPMVAAVLACGILTRDDDPATEVIDLSGMHVEGAAARIDDPLPTTDQDDDPATEVIDLSGMHAEETDAQIDDPLPATEESERTVVVLGEILAATYGDTLIEEKIFGSDVIVKATMTSFSSETIADADSKYTAVLKFNLDVSEYLKGTGPSSIVAVWVDGRSYDTNDGADDAKAAILAERDDQWDGREAIIFLYGVVSGFGVSLDAQLQLADHFLLFVGDPYSPDDFYSLHSREHKRWLPAASGAGSTGDGQEFLLDVPPPSGSGSTAPTITLGGLKTRVAEVAAEFDGGDGSEAHETCVKEKYEFERIIRHRREVEGRDAYDKSPQDSSLASGQPANTELHQRLNGGAYPSKKAKTWLEGRDADLFTVVQGEPTAVDVDGDGSFTTESDGIEFTETFATARPLPAGEYEIDRKEVWSRYLLCNYVLSNEWTITVDAPEGVLHEAFFDPVTVGSAVAADSANGVLKPASFTDANGATSTIERIAWEPGTGATSIVKLKLSPHDGIAGHVVDFIELDGTASLSLNADDAAVDAANHTLSWTVASQPWEDGDKLMARIREVRGTCSNGTVVPNPGENPELVRDCTVLLDSMAALSGRASLDWNTSTIISSWEGITLNASSTRVTGLDLGDEALDGSIPPALGRLSALMVLDLSDNDLTGEIPSELGLLSKLTTLKLGGNRLTGCIPLALKSVAANDLGALGLLYCRPPAPESLSTDTPGESSVALMWKAVADAGRYRVEYRIATSTAWSVDDDMIAGTAHTVDGLSCESEYVFRVSSYGSGTTYAAAWSAPSAVVSATTAMCGSLVFDAPAYSFSVPEDAATTTLVGVVTATGSSGGAVSYSITSGNEAGRFAIGESTGEIVVAGSLDYETTASYVLRVAASGTMGTATTTVKVAVTDVPEGTPAAPVGVSASLSEGAFSISWDALPGAARYEVQYRTDGGAWGVATTTTASAVEFTHGDGPACGTTYEFRVRAYGDGAVYAAAWGEPSEAAAVRTAACNEPPEFASSTYAFSISVDAAASSTVGTVTANDPEGTAVTYAITAGNDAGKFAIGPSSGEIIVAGALDAVAVSSYRLTVEARDVIGASAEVEVGISVVPSRCSNGVVVPNPGSNPGLVSDCMTLLAAKDTLRGTATLDWSATTTIAKWEGVTVGGTPSRVTGLLLTDKGLTGSIPADLSRLTDLRELNLSENRLTGGIPAELGGLTNLVDLRLFSNQLSGDIPTRLARLTKLSSLQLDDNRLTGSIPTELGSLTNLRDLFLNSNRLTGSIPTELGSLSNLRDLFLNGNQLTGSIPTELGSLTNLRHLNLDNNRLTGSIPTQLGSLSNLRDLSLSGNRLTGSIPTQLGNLANLRDLFLDGNRLTGAIPPELGSLAKLELLNLTGNGLTGAIPSQLGSLTKLRWLYLNGNGLTGQIPTQLGGLSNLETLWLSGNSFAGCIPPALRGVDDNDLARLALLDCG